MMLNAIFSITSVISWLPVHLSMLSWSLFFFLPVFHTIFIPSHWLLFHIAKAVTIDYSERYMNPFAMTIIYRKKYLLSQRSNQRPPVLKFCMLPSVQHRFGKAHWEYADQSYLIPYQTTECWTGPN